MPSVKLNARFTALKSKFIRFAMVGGIATACQYLILVIMVELLSANAVLSSAIGFILSSLLNYRLNYSFTFRSALSHMVALPKFLVTAMIGLIINTGSMFILVDIVKVYYLISQVVATGLTLLWNFSINSIWSFRDTIDSRGES